MRITKILLVALLAWPLSFSPAQAATTVSWSSTTRLQGLITIPVGQVVTVAPNTLINVASGSKLIVAGTLLAPSGFQLVGKNWDGLVITGTAKLAKFVETGAQTPFRITATGRLIIHGGKISAVNGASLVEGTHIADHLSYDKGSGAGIDSVGGGGVISIDQSTLKGSGRDSGDFFGISALKSISLTNSQMSGAHCAFHVTGVNTMVLANDYIFNNAYGFMMYGSSEASTRNITDTTITNNSFGFDEGSAYNRNGAITISHSYIKGNDKDLGLYTGKVKLTAALLTNPHR